MKRIILLSFVVIAITANTFAQLGVGVKAGLNYSSIKAENKEFDQSGILGYQAGIWARLGDAFYFQPEIYLGSKGADLKFSTNNTVVTQREKIKFTTLDVPLLVGTKIGFDKLNFRLMGGPSLQFNLDKNENVFSQATNPDFYKYEDFVTNIQVGAGVDIGNISVDLRYETGLQDINKNNGQRLNLVHLSLGFKIL